jgi:VIT1/CCC1 family predicted Fe2+/Mn2+ transporter
LLAILLSLAFSNLILSFDKYERKLKQVIQTVIGGVFPLAVLVIVALNEILILPIVVVFTALFIVVFKLVK